MRLAIETFVCAEATWAPRRNQRRAMKTGKRQDGFILIRSMTIPRMMSAVPPNGHARRPGRAARAAGRWSVGFDAPRTDSDPVPHVVLWSGRFRCRNRVDVFAFPWRRMRALPLQA